MQPMSIFLLAALVIVFGWLDYRMSERTKRERRELEDQIQRSLQGGS